MSDLFNVNQISRRDSLSLGSIGTLQLTVPAEESHLVKLSGFRDVIEFNDVIREKSLLSKTVARPVRKFVAQRENAFVNQGLQRVLDLMFNATKGSLSGISHIAVTGDTNPVTASTTDMDPAPASGVSIKTVQNVSRTNQTTHGDATWTQADVNFVITKLGFLYGAATNNVMNIIGGSGGASPYNEPFAVDLVNISQWTLNLGIDLTAVAS